MRVAGPLLTLSALLIAAPALAQGGGYYTSGSGPYNWDRFDRFEYYPPPQRQTWQAPLHHGVAGYWQWHPYPQQSDAQWQQPDAMQQRAQAQGGPPSAQTGSSQMGQQGASTHGPVSFATKGQIKNSLESSGFKNITVVPESYMIRATAPDGSRILMQVSSDSLYGIVVNPADHGGSGGMVSGSGTGNTSGSAGTTGNSGATTGAGETSTTGNKNSGSSMTGGTGGSASTSGGAGMTSGTGGSGSSTGTGSTSGSASH